MRSFRQKLADLPSQGATLRKDPVRTTATPAAAPVSAPAPVASNDVAPASAPVIATSAASASAVATAPTGKPSLDELRARIAALVGRRDPPRPRPDPSAGELPFFVERTASGPRYVRRVRAAPAARVGRVPLVAARDADPVTLGLLALDPTLAACDPRRALYLDTETTGLAGGTGTVAFLVGLAFFDAEHGVFVLEQMLLRRLGEEAPILELLERRLAEASMIVTYNGKAFDMPLLRTRFVMNRKPRPPEVPHLDLLHVARRVHRHRLPTCTLASIEHQVLGRERVGDVSGMDIVEAYSHFLRTGDEGALHGVVTHNEHDVLAMVALLGLYGEPFGVVDEGGVGAVEKGRVARDLLDLQADPASAPAPGVIFSPGRQELVAGVGGADPEWQTAEHERGWADVHVPCAGPGGGLGGADLAGVARTLHRAGATSRALALADEALRTGGGVVARRVSADISRALGDTPAARLKYEAILEEQDDPEVRFLLVKLYEHRDRDYARALALLAAGTTESEDATRLRRARLERKLAAALAPPKRRAPKRKP